jgi:hypothetical protein
MRLVRRASRGVRRRSGLICRMRPSSKIPLLIAFAQAQQEFYRALMLI